MYTNQGRSQGGEGLEAPPFQSNASSHIALLRTNNEQVSDFEAEF